MVGYNFCVCGSDVVSAAKLVLQMLQGLKVWTVNRSFHPFHPNIISHQKQVRLVVRDERCHLERRHCVTEPVVGMYWVYQNSLYRSHDFF